MSERSFRFVLGGILWIILIYSAYYDSVILLYAFIAYLLFEGITNLRLTLLTQKLFGKDSTHSASANQCNITFLNRIEAEQVLRIIIAGMVYISTLYFTDLLWFLPWFVSGMLIMAGITNICPMQMFLKWSGLR